MASGLEASMVDDASDPVDSEGSFGGNADGPFGVDISSTNAPGS